MPSILWSWIRLGRSRTCLESAQALDDELVVLDLRQARRVHRPDDAHAGDLDREAPTVWGVLGLTQSGGLRERRVALLVLHAHGEGRGLEALHDSRLPADPVVGVRNRAGQRDAERESAQVVHLDDDRQAGGPRARDGEESEVDGVSESERGELDLRGLSGQ